MLLANFDARSYRAADGTTLNALGAAEPTESVQTQGPPRPIAIASQLGRYWIANQRRGSVFSVNFAGELGPETIVGQRLSSVYALPGGKQLAITDELANELLIADCLPSGELQVRSRHRTAGGPVAVAALQHSAAPGDPSQLTNSIVVAARWAHRLYWFQSTDSSDLPSDDTQLDSSGDHPTTIDLPFAPGRLVATAGSEYLVIADASGPYLGVVETATRRLINVVSLPGHNLHGLAVSHDGTQLLVAHQMLNDFIPTSRDHVFWGNVLSNMLRTLPLSELCRVGNCSLDKAAKLHGSLVPLGREGLAAGDPRVVRVSPAGDVLVAIAGTGELAVRRPDGRQFTRLGVGRRPTDVLVSDDGLQAIVVNCFDNTLSFVDLGSLKVAGQLELGMHGTPTEIDRGEELFYDASLSLHGWFSCHSCHTDGHTCGLLNDNLGDDSFGAPKRIPSLLGTAGTGPWAWNGGQQQLTAQIEKSLRKTMHGDENRQIAAADVRALAAYLVSLPPAPPLAGAREESPQALVAAGEQLFRQLDCSQCHRPPSFTTPDTYDVGLTDERGVQRFNPPSLRGVGQRGRWLHDGRCYSLSDVLRVHPHPGGNDLSPDVRDALVAYLETL
ncbi:MAG: hypothetical protein KDB23_13405 [Planctomycetales bacterium]|nr:hypothetical protein [Planctomycetales bacterium]